MRYLIISDVHSNIEALDAVLKAAKQFNYDQVLCCGDVVGYNADPEAVIDRLIEEKAICIRGNHDREAVIGGGEDFNGAAKEAIKWTTDVLTPMNGNWDHFNWLADLPKGPLKISNTIQLVHGSQNDEDEYIQYVRDESKLACRFTFFGHTHQPGVYNSRGRVRPMNSFMDLPTGNWMINPGSVGQPRDNDPRASFAIFDTKGPRVKLVRVPYDVRTTQKKIIEAGLPLFLAERLSPNGLVVGRK